MAWEVAEREYLIRLMKTYTIKLPVVHAAAPMLALGKPGASSPFIKSVIKLGNDVHARLYVVVAQYDHAALKPPMRFAPKDLLPWVRRRLGEGHTVHVVHEACGFGFGLHRELVAAGAHSYVIAPRKLDEQNTGVKTDNRDAATLCQRLSR